MSTYNLLVDRGGGKYQLCLPILPVGRGRSTINVYLSYLLIGGEVPRFTQV